MPKKPNSIDVQKLSGIVDQMVDGYWAWDNTPAFTLETNGPSNAITVNVSGLGAAGKSMARDAMESWETVADITFREINGTAQINFAEKGNGAFTQFDFNDDDTAILGATVNVGTGWLDTYDIGIGSYSFQTYIHETGHALGLGHPGDYKDDLQNYPNGQLFNLDSWQVSVMSYYGQDRNPNVNATRASTITPQAADILAIQELYGAASGAETAGDTVYGMNSNLGTYLGAYFRDTYLTDQFPQFDATYTLADSGGTDTIDTSFLGRGSIAFLDSGSISSVIGKEGNLIIMPGTVIENFIAGRGEDVITGNAVANMINSGGGNDSIYGKSGNDELFGDDGNDLIVGNGGTDKLVGGGGVDKLRGGGANDELYGGAGGDKMNGGRGDDLLDGDVGGDRMDGGNGDDDLAGGVGADNLSGGRGRDALDGGGGDDIVSGGGGNDNIIGDAGKDSLSGGGGKDTLSGDAGDDTVSGDGGNDNINGGIGDDILSGGAGKDRLVADLGDDVMSGGGGRDVFVFSRGKDAITDFSARDSILFSNELDRDGSLNIAKIIDRADVVRGDIVVDFGFRGKLTLDGFSDLDTFADRIDIL